MARKNGRLGDIHSVDDCYFHDVDELMALAPHLPDRVNGAEGVLAAPFILVGTRRGQLANGEGVGRGKSALVCLGVHASSKTRGHFANASIHRLSSW